MLHQARSPKLQINKLVVGLLLSITVPLDCASHDVFVHGTALVVGIAQEGIVLGQDHLRASEFETVNPTIPKFSFCTPEIVCGTAGLAQHEFSCSFKDNAGLQRGGILKYDSYSWLASMKKEGQNSINTSPKSIADSIWKKASSTFDPIECFYFHTKEGQDLIGSSDGPVMYVVAGYPSDSANPEVYAVRVQYDRQNLKFVYPPPEKIFPTGSEKLPLCFVAGDQQRFDALREKREPFVSIFHDFYSKRLIRAYLIFKDAPTPLQETVAWVAGFIDLESEFNKNVGGGSSIGVIRRGQSPVTLFMPLIASK